MFKAVIMGSFPIKSEKIISLSDIILHVTTKIHKFSLIKHTSTYTHARTHAHMPRTIDTRYNIIYYI